MFPSHRISLGFGLAIVAIFSACREPEVRAPNPVGRHDSSLAPSDTGHGFRTRPPREIPAPLRGWIWRTLRESGELGWIDSFVSKDLGRRTRLRDSGDTWTVNFQGMDIGVLGDGTDERWGDIRLRVLVAGTRLCGEPGGAPFSDQIRDKLEGLDQVRCSAKDHDQAVRRWYTAQFGRVPTGSELRLGPDGAVDFLRIACKAPDSLRRIGLLRDVPVDTLEIEGCMLSVQEQKSLPRSIGSLRLHRVRGQAFEYTGVIGNELRIEGGDFSWVRLRSPENAQSRDGSGHDSRRPRLTLSGLSVCRPELLARLAEDGFQVDSTCCETYPSDLFVERKRWDSAFERTRANAQAVKGSVGLRYDDQPVYDTALLDRFEAVEIDDNPFEDPGPVELTPRLVRYGKDGMDMEGGNNSHYFLRGPALHATVHGKQIRAGMTRAQLIGILGKPSLDRGEFLAWRTQMECDQSPFAIQARFDAEGRLIGWFDQSDPMCGC